MKKIVLALALLGAGAAPAAAADLATRPFYKAPIAEPAYYSWAGPYIGVNGGGGWGQSRWHFDLTTNNTSPSTSGGFVGGQIGYNWQAGAWVFGLEADGDWADIHGSALCPNPAFVCAAKTDALASFRARAGYAVNNWLFYGTGGLANADTKYTATSTALGSSSFSTDRWGYAAGAGIEWGFLPNWSAKLEYMHYGFDRATVAAGAFARGSTGFRLDIDTVKAGVNYHFNLASY